jgi:hypothetical protein
MAIRVEREGGTNMSDEELYESLLEGLYNDTLLSDAYQMLMDGQTHEGMEHLVIGLRERRLDSGDQEWKEFVRLCMLHPICQLVHQDPFTHRAYAKPRGYAGDAVLLDYIYGDEGRCTPPEGTSEIGRAIFDYTIKATAAEGVRARAHLVAETVDRLAMEVHRPNILSVAGGHLREASLSGALKQKRLGRWTVVDWDAESLQQIERDYSRYGVETKAGTVRQLLTGNLQPGEFDFIYTTGLFDYLQQSIGQRLVQRMFELLRPRGQILVANFLPKIRDIGYMESFMDWYLIYRSAPEMLDLGMTIDQTQVRDIRISAEDLQNIMFLQITKK